MQTVADITFIGGGIAGLLSARRFSLAGAKVTLIDKCLLGQESSWAGGGILLPLYPWRQADAISALLLSSLTQYPCLNEDLQASTGLDAEYYVSGLLMNRLPDKTEALAWCADKNMPVSAIPARYLQYAHDESLYLPSIAQVRNPRLLKALKQDVIQRGVTVLENCDIQRLKIKNKRITHIYSKQHCLPINQLVLTTGAWTQQLWAEFFTEARIACRPDIQPVKGQMILFQSTLEVLETMILEADRYLIPRRDGRILCGSTVEQAQFNKQTTDAAKQSLTAFAYQLCPQLKRAAIINHWAGLRPATPQGIPYIDIHPELNNLAINAGHFRNGFAMGPASAQLLYERIMQIPTHLDSTPYQFSMPH